MEYSFHLFWPNLDTFKLVSIINTLNDQKISNNVQVGGEQQIRIRNGKVDGNSKEVAIICNLALSILTRHTLESINQVDS